MNVYVVQRDCGDYYCGCGGGHIVGVFTSPDAAREAKDVDSIWGGEVTEVTLDEARWDASKYGTDRAWT